MSAPAPFHFAFFIRELESTRRFYVDVLGCREGRSTATWVDFDFFGNQISAHLSDSLPDTRNTGQVDGVAVPMPHFRAAQIPFVIEPRSRYVGEPGEQATMFLLDPSGNALEFKSFRNPAHVFTA